MTGAPGSMRLVRVILTVIRIIFSVTNKLYSQTSL